METDEKTPISSGEESEQLTSHSLGDYGKVSVPAGIGRPCEDSKR